MTTPTKTLAEALVAFQTNVPVIGKGKTAKVTTKSGPSYSYSYADLAAITPIVLPALAAVGLSFTTLPRRNDDGTFDLVGVLRHTSGETVEGVLPLFTRGSAQETGSSLTYVRRYLLLSMTGVAPDDDDDGASATQAHRRHQSQPRPQQAPQEVSEVDRARDQAFHRYTAVSAGATRDEFIEAVTQEFAQPFLDVTAEQLTGFLSS